MLIQFLKPAGLLLLFFPMTAAMGLACLSLINPPYHLLDRFWNTYSKLFIGLALGLTLWIMGLAFIGLIGAFNKVGIFSLLLMPCFAFSYLLSKHKDLRNIFSATFGWEAVSAFSLLLIVLFSSFHAPGHFDDTMYHLPLARSYLKHEAIALEQFVRFPLFPQNMNLLMGLGLLVAGDAGAQALATLPLGLIALGLLGLSIGLTDSCLLGVVSSGLMYFIGPVQQTLGYAYVDNGLSFFCFASVVAAAFWAVAERTNHSAKWLLISGALAGSAIGTKYFGLVFSGLIFVFLLTQNADRKNITTFILSLLCTGLGWYIRSYLISGDPFHPVGGGFFGYYLWDADDLVAQHQEQDQHGIHTGFLNIHAALEKAHASILIVGLGSLFLRKPHTVIRWLRFTYLAYLLFWFFFSQVNRYLAPIIPIGILLGGYVVYSAVTVTPWITRMHGTKFASFTQSLLVLYVLTTTSHFAYEYSQLRNKIWTTALSMHPGYSLITKANAFTSDYGDRLVQLGFENSIYFFHGTTIGDWFGPGRYRSWLQCDENGCGLINPRALIARMQSFNANILVVSKALVNELNLDELIPYFSIENVDDSGVLMTRKLSDLSGPEGDHTTPIR